MSEQPQSPAPAVALVALIALYFILAAFIPRWWAATGAVAEKE